MKEISTQYRLLFVGGIHSITDDRMLLNEKSCQLLEDDVLEVFFGEKALRADLSGYCIDDHFAAQQYCIRQQLESERKTASSHDQDP